MPNRVPLAVLALALTLGLATVSTQERKTLYLVATAHLDSQWNWTVQDTIRQFVPSTFYTNFKYFEQYPDYVFTWEGAIHYMWFKEYHPEDWPTVQKYVAARRWRLAGSWLNAVDTNMPSPESLFRQALYAKRFFRQEFNTVSQDVYLPDCFGFGFALPSIAAHSGLKSFSTQKLTWGRAIPFPIGRWQGADGSQILAELKPGNYVTRVESDPSTDPKWSDDPTPLGDGTSVVFRYFGTGDTGGGPTDESVANVQRALTNANAPIAVKNTSADQLSRDITADEFKALPLYTGELILKTHGTGCYTAQAAMKRFNRSNELLADAAERSAVAAEYLTGLAYPTARLREAWTRFLWHQFHDDLTGTCIPQAYQFSWNDELTSLNQFAGVLTSSTTAAATQLKTSGTGVPLVIFNPLSLERREPVEATIHTAVAPAARLTAIDATTGEVSPVQVLDRTATTAHVLFRATVPPVGYKVVHLQTAAAPARESGSEVAVTPDTIENNRLLVRIDRNGDIASIYDKDAKHELLRAPIMLELRDDPSTSWPAWEVLYDTVQAPAREYASHPAVRVVERGPVRAALEITRHASGSTFVQRVSLTAGGDRVNVENLVDWRSPNTLLKASFPFTAANAQATYDLGLGTIERTGNERDQYEVPAQKWADISDVSGTFGVGILNDSKYGWDKPDQNTLRLTLLHTPRPDTRYTYQSSNDLGHHRFVFAVAGHAGDWRHGRLPERAAELNQPLVAFEADRHDGPLGAAFSMASLDDTTGQVAITAMKHAEDGDELVVRLQERYGRPAHVTLRLPSAVLAAREINAAEEAIAPIDLSENTDGRDRRPRPSLPLDFTPYQPRTIAVKLAPRGGTATVERTSAPLELPFNLDGVTTDRDRQDGDFDGKQHSLSAELLPRELHVDGVTFALGSGEPGQKNVLVPEGQVLRVPDGSFNRLYVVAAAIGEDVQTTMAGQPLDVREWQGPIGQWWSRLKAPSALWEPFVPAVRQGQTVATVPSQREIQDGLVVQWDPSTGVVSGIDQIRPAFVKRDEVAWVGSHRHAPDGNEIYVASYLFLYGVDLPAGAKEVRLPSDKRLRILAVSAVREPKPLRPAGALYVADVPEPKR